MSSLADKTCVPCRGDVPALKGRDLESLHREVSQWKVVTEHHVTRTFTFPDFRKALDFVNRVGELAEQQGHHPDILLAWGKAKSPETAWNLSSTQISKHRNKKIARVYYEAVLILRFYSTQGIGSLLTEVIYAPRRDRDRFIVFAFISMSDSCIRNTEYDRDGSSALNC